MPEGSASVNTSAPGSRLSLEELAHEFIDSIRTGMTAMDDIYTDTGVLLLSAGSRITPRFLHLLRERGIDHVRWGAPPGVAVTPPAELEEAPRLVQSASDFQTPRSKALDKRLDGALMETVNLNSIKVWRRPRLSVEDLKNEAAEGLERHHATTAAVSDLCDSLRTGKKMFATDLRRHVSHFVNMSTIDFDLLPLIVAMKESDDDYLYSHCVNVALLTLSIAAQMGLDRESVTAIGMGGLLQDIGMMRVPDSIRLSDGELGGREWHEIHLHPLHTVDMLSNLTGIPQSVKFIGYQAHERIDGSGYPNHRRGDRLHMFARIVALADVFAAMTSDRPYRSALTPYAAARTILLKGTANQFDRTLVRGFLDTVSLFPIGSSVELSNGQRARVLRANPGSHTRPVVEELDADGSVTGQTIDLSKEPSLHVVTAS
ncbi:MAG: HD-GYP domain-containing protein [Planctomycetes bacterium]|nr:HD-GYP domain-containing protein [Planctomycetota bacterium]